MAGSRHPISLVLNKIVSIFERIGFTVAEEREWRWLAQFQCHEHIQTTILPGICRILLLKRFGDSFVANPHIFCTGGCPDQHPTAHSHHCSRKRIETISARSHCQFHQVEGLLHRRKSFIPLIWNKPCFILQREMYGIQTEIRLRPSYFPFTEPSAEMDVLGLKDEVESPHYQRYPIIGNSGLWNGRSSGVKQLWYRPWQIFSYAFGMGIERQAMLCTGSAISACILKMMGRFLRQFHSAQ